VYYFGAFYNYDNSAILAYKNKILGVFKMNDEELTQNIKVLYKRVQEFCGQLHPSQSWPKPIEFNTYVINIDTGGEVFLNDGSDFIGLIKKEGGYLRREVEGYTRKESEEHGNDYVTIYDILKKQVLIRLKSMDELYESRCKELEEKLKKGGHGNAANHPLFLVG
jgi:hypothetical protein